KAFVRPYTSGASAHHPAQKCGPMSIGSTIPLTSEPQAADAARASGFLENSIPVYFVLGTFFAITLPFSVFAIAESDFFGRNSVLVAFYLCSFSITHFALTL